MQSSPVAHSSLDYVHGEKSGNLSARVAQPGIPVWKRVLDITCILLASPILLPLGLLIGLTIKLMSSGPVLFKQERIGYLGRRFRCLKFRTMRVNADHGIHQQYLTQLIKSGAPMTKLDSAGDPRLIPCGLILRSFGLDELPQLLNVLRGEMSLVGPRPSIPFEHEAFSPHHRRRCETLPGLTGYWQVNGKNRTTFEEMMNLDLYYVEHKSLRLDLWIMARTIPAIVAQYWEVKRRREATRSSAVGKP